MARNKDGTFKRTTGSAKYQRVFRGGKDVQYHNVVWEETVGKIPKGFVVHHIDHNGWNNDINNLALCTVTGHNRIHAHRAWNKGITALENKEWARTIDKIQYQRRKHFMKIWKEWKNMKDNGISISEIAIKYSKVRETIQRGIKTYDLQIKSGEYNNEKL